MSNKVKLSVTPIDDLVKASQGALIELPPFIDGEPFIAKLKRPSMLELVRSGKIPNSLISTANDLFSKGGFNTEEEDALKNLFCVLDTICEACFVEPTYAELKEAGVTLTDDQLMFVFNYTQRGVAALGNFRSQLKNSRSFKNEQAVQQNSK